MSNIVNLPGVSSIPFSEKSGFVKTVTYELRAGAMSFTPQTVTIEDLANYIVRLSDDGVPLDSKVLLFNGVIKVVHEVK